MTNSGSFTHDQVLELYKKHIDPEHQYKVISLEELSKLTVAGRSNCVLATEKLENEEVSMPPVQDRLEDLIIEYKNNL